MCAQTVANKGTKDHFYLFPLARVSEWTLSGAEMCNTDTSCRCRKSVANCLFIHQTILQVEVISPTVGIPFLLKI